MNDLVAKAIETKTVLRLYYDTGWRLVEPHCLGIGKDGQILLRAYQIHGATKSGDNNNWKLFRLDNPHLLEVTNDNFIGPRPLYNPNDPVMKRGIIKSL